MKNQFIITLILTLLVASCTEKKYFIIEGNIADGGKEKLFLYRMDLRGDVFIDSLKMKNGNFRFKLKPLEEPAFFKLQLTPNSFITLLGDTTEQIKVTGAKDSFSRQYKVENSQGSLFVQALVSKIKELRVKVDSLNNLYVSLSDNEKVIRLDDIGNEMISAIDDYKKYIGEFVLSNTRSFASYYALFLTLSDNTMVMNVWDKKDQIYFAASATSLNLMYPESERVKHLYSYVLSVKREQRLNDQIEKLMSEATDEIPDIKVEDVNGNEIALSSLRGKVVLLSFWASWDEVSRRENGFLKYVYEKYRSKGFEIYQVGLERSKVLWEGALQNDEIPWISVSDLQYTDSYPAKVYNISKIPANYLISRDGKIIGKDLFGSLLDDKLQQFLK